MNPAPILSADQIVQALTPFGVNLDAGQVKAIQTYIELLRRWNRSISLSAVEDPLEIVARHFGESFFAGTFLPLQHGRLADVGSGAGFPGLALKIAFPNLYVVLLESNLKKCAFLGEAKAKLGLRDIEIARSRYEDYRAELPFDFIFSRALGNYHRLLRWAGGFIARSGKIGLWLGTEDSLLVSRTKGWTWDIPRPVPNSRRRVILCGGRPPTRW